MCAAWSFPIISNDYAFGVHSERKAKDSEHYQDHVFPLSPTPRPC